MIIMAFFENKPHAKDENKALIHDADTFTNNFILWNLQESLCMCLRLSVRNRLLNHAHHADETITGDSMGLE